MSKKVGRMLAPERQRRILEVLDRDGAVTISGICEMCDVTSVTARTDLGILETAGKLKRTHGGAVPVTEFVVPAVSQRMRRNVRPKQMIASYAAGLVQDGETILVGSGSTTFEFVKALGQKRDVTVVTNDCNIIDYAEERMLGLRIASTGGILGREYRHYYGPLLSASIEGLHVDKVFMGADGFDPAVGFTAEFARTASSKVEFLRHAEHRIMLMDSSKLGVSRSFTSFAGSDDIDLVIMDNDPDGVVAAALPGVEVVSCELL